MLTETAHKFRQGMIAANTSAVISRHARGRGLDKAEIRTLTEAARLLGETVRGATVFDPGIKQLNADNNAIRSFSSAIAAIRACGRNTQVSELKNIVLWLENIQTTVAALASNQRGSVAKKDVKTAKEYFDCLSEEMRAAVNRPRVEQPFLPQL